MNCVIRFKKGHPRKVICSYTIKVKEENFLTVFCLGPGLISTSPRSKSKLNLNHR